MPTPRRFSITIVFAFSSVVAAVGLCAELTHAVIHSTWSDAAVSMLSQSYEANLPTWYASSLLLCCAIALGMQAQRSAPPSRSWWGLCGLFIFMSVDEAVQIHEHLYVVSSGSGLFHYSWVIPGTLLAAAAGLAFVPLLRALPSPVRRAFIVSGVVYLGGAIAMELPLGWWAERAGTDNLIYAIIDWVEESLELFGASMFLVAVVRHNEVNP